VKGLETHCCLQDAAQIEDTNNWIEIKE
jgi:hypothetical protein